MMSHAFGAFEINASSTTTGHGDGGGQQERPDDNSELIGDEDQAVSAASLVGVFVHLSRPIQMQTQVALQAFPAWNCLPHGWEL